MLPISSYKQIISRYAPPNENQTKAYIKTVAEQIGVYPDTIIDIEERGILTVFIKAVTHYAKGMWKLRIVH